MRYGHVGLVLCLLLAGELMNAQTTGQSREPSLSFADVVGAADTVSPTAVLSDSHEHSLVAVSARLQGRVLTSSVDGWNGRSLGWVNKKLIASEQLQTHFNAYGGEDRIWIAPEGGQFSVFFAPKAPFDLDHWYTPAPVDTEPFEVVRQSKESVSFKKRFTLENYSGTKFEVQVNREVKLLPDDQVWQDLKVDPVKRVKIVAFESLNRLTNAGEAAWSEKTGLLAIWILGQFQASPFATIVIPIHEGSVTQLGVPVTSDYFGPIPSERLAVKPNAIFMRADAEYRGKLGINPARARGLLGSYDAQHHLLTIVQQTFSDPSSDYVNNAWKIQEEPFKGDVTNAYNDGPQANGARLGHFYEMESLSPAAALEPGQFIEHAQRTFHFEGDEQQLDKIARAVLGVSLWEINTALSNSGTGKSDNQAP